MQKSADAFRTISEVADDLSLPQHVLRFWETRFPQIRPLKRAGGRRYYRPTDVLLLKSIRQLLYDDGYTIKGVQRLLKEQGARGLGLAARPDEAAEVLPVGIDQLDTSAPATERPELLEEATRFLMAADYTRLSDAHREAIEMALETVEECKRLLEVARRPS